MLTAFYWPEVCLCRNLIRSTALMFKILGEFLVFMKVRKKYWLFPIMIVTALLGGLILLTKGSAVAPFIYTLF